MYLLTLQEGAHADALSLEAKYIFTHQSVLSPYPGVNEDALLSSCHKPKIKQK